MQRFFQATRPGFHLIAAVLAFSAHVAVAQTGTGYYRTSGPDILDPSGAPVVLRGLGLGGWLMPEGYMLHVSAPDGGSPRSIRARIEDLIGKADADTYDALFRANYVEQKDVDSIAAWGFDHVRLPFHYRVLYNPDTGTFDEAGFALIDEFLEWCRPHNLGVILDLHAAPGAQNSLNISDSDGQARLWTEPVPYQDQTVEIWTEIARRYAGETLIIGYDLINEPVLPQGVPGSALRALYVRLAEAIRPIDPHHILFIEGNHFATDFSALTPPFDGNMVYAFHKYWNDPGQGTIQYLLDIRAQHNVPLWLGESGENSNAWFFEVTRLMERLNIGWNWWTHKKIETTTAPLSAPFAPGYQAVVDYWRGAGPRPSASAARAALFGMARGLDLDSTQLRPGVLAALLDPDYGRRSRPFTMHRIPGVVNAAQYDIGNQWTAYFDRDYRTTGGSPGGGNTGGQYRNDGVDIERSTDPQGFAYNVGWMEDTEWLTYTVEVETAGRYDVEFRVASAGGGGRLRALLGTTPLGADLTIPSTGGWQSWRSVWLRDVALPAGRHVLKLDVRTGGFNLNRLRFNLVTATGAEEPEKTPGGMGLLRQFPNPFVHQTELTFTSPVAVRAGLAVYDVLGREVYRLPAQPFGAGVQTLSLRPDLPPGLYVYRLTLDSGHRQHVETGTATVL